MGWFPINILVPLFAPLLVFAMLWALPMPQSNRESVLGLMR